MLDKKWIIKNEPSEEFQKMHPKLHPIILKLLYTRGIKDPNEVDLFLNPLYEQLHDPFLFKDMNIAVDRVLQAIENKESIVIHGDYDADGVTSSAILYKTLKVLGANVEVFIPHREKDGYGVSIKTIKTFVGKYQLMITVDCGVSNVDEIRYAGSKGIDVIVTDHHDIPPVLPSALAIINPKIEGETYPFKSLCGAGVAYKLACAVLQKQKINPKALNVWGGAEGFAKWLLDLVAIGTVADVMPLIGENRILVKYGLKVLAATKRIGLKDLAEISSIDLTKEDGYIIGFQIAPRLNAAGRMTHALYAFELLVTEDPVKSVELASLLHATNSDRQKVTETSKAVALAQVENSLDDNLLFVYSEDIPGGIVGLIAGRLSDLYFKPSLVITKTGEHLVGSGRSIPNYDITKSLYKAQEVLSRFGGHSQACGFTLKGQDYLEKFKELMVKDANENIKKEDMVPVINIDSEVTISNIDLSVVKQIEQLAPFGEANKKPVFVIRNIFITAIDSLGNTGRHLRIMGKTDDSYVVQKFMLFGQGEVWRGIINIGDTVDLVVELGVNVWNGTESVDAKVLDIKKK